MKRIYLFSTILSILLLLPACGNDWLDEMVPQTDVETEKSMNTAKEAEQTLNGIYSLFRKFEYYGARYTYYGDATGEDMLTVNDSKRVAKYYLFELTEVNSPTNFWSFPYQVIRNANNILSYVNSLDEADLTSALKDIKGQALTIRAMGHFDLVKVFGEPYTKSNGASLGVPVVPKNIATHDKPARNTVAEVYDQILKDLTEASGLISKSKNDGKVNWFATRLLLARAYLYMDNNSEAYKVVSELIQEVEGGKTYKLFSNSEYASAWKEKTGSEYFYVIQNNSAEISDSKEFISYLMHPSGYDDISVSDDYLNLFEDSEGENVPLKLKNGEAVNDVRLKLITYKNNTKEVGDFYYLGKYMSPDYITSNIPVLRLSEAYLIGAEAAFKSNNKSKAVEYLNKIVSRGNPDASVKEGDITLDRILVERRKELVGEGHRLFDAMRNNKKIERKGVLHRSTLLTADTKSFDWNYEKILLPIPVKELNANPNMKQNPGYGK